MLTDEYRYRILKLLEADPSASQRKLADQLGISLGRVNFCLQALIDKGREVLKDAGAALRDATKDTRSR